MAQESRTDQQAHLIVIVVAVLLVLIYQLTNAVGGVSRDEMVRLGTVSGPNQPPSSAPEPGNELTAGGTSLLPLSGAASADGSLIEFVGQSAIGRGVVVLTVPADEGFWVGAGILDRVWVQLTGSGESPYTVLPGDLAYFVGTVVAHSPGYARTADAGDPQSVELLIAQEAHIEVAQDDLGLTH